VLHGKEDTLQVDRHHRIPRSFILICNELACAAKTGVVESDVQSTKHLDSFADHVAAIIAPRDVSFHGYCLSARLMDEVRDALTFLLPAGGNYDLGALAGQF
jgi:hypothetical protein